jgi:hypothetical protein
MKTLLYWRILHLVQIVDVFDFIFEQGGFEVNNIANATRQSILLSDRENIIHTQSFIQVTSTCFGSHEFPVYKEIDT